ncbi:uncharacterized protein LOC109862930 [Pseudomyrmex gracilis]|uniref:uncharacterized protein LOC109862930 n=1 Tax=Pseudomyrmex gracilis TaxID=219809 RepID=UPI000995A550|nr:uncharacterized protein LOC109862930 [Pseudomyrmex gracilis]
MLARGTPSSSGSNDSSLVLDSNSGDRPHGVLTKQLSSASLFTSKSRGMSTGIIMSPSKVYAFKQSLANHSDNVSRILLSSKESLDKRREIESAFRTCREAFSELSAVYLALLEKENNAVTIESVKEMITDAVSKMRSDTLLHRSAGLMSEDGSAPSVSYAAAVKSASSIRVARGPTVAVKKSTDILIVPNKDQGCKYSSSSETKEALKRIIKPANFNLKVNKITSTRNNGVRIEAATVDLPKIKDSAELAKAGLKVKQIAKSNPRLIVHGVPIGLNKEIIRSELIDLNLNSHDSPEVKVIYIFPPKTDRTTTSCIIEVPPDVRTMLRREQHVYINFSSCVFEDYVRVLQCYKCLAFGHLAKNCKGAALCGHCAGDHEMRDCHAKSEATTCGNCRRWLHSESTHSALDGKNCPILIKRLQEKIKNINYEQFS